jgi:hypothetical protein
MMMLVGPNQRIVARMLEVYTARYGLKVRTLPWQQYTNGKHLLTNRKRKRVEEMLAAADVLHFCWTLNIDDKYNKMKVSCTSTTHPPTQRSWLSLSLSLS